MKKEDYDLKHPHDLSAWWREHYGMGMYGCQWKRVTGVC